VRILGVLGGSLLWLLAGVVGLLGVVLCLTLVLLPVGVVLLAAARKLFGYAMMLMLPRAVRHPVDEVGRSVGRRSRDVKDAAGGMDLDRAGKRARKAAGKVTGEAAKKAGEAGKKEGKARKATGKAARSATAKASEEVRKPTRSILGRRRRWPG